ncbi:hypothetical protein HPP92_013515 [Vanilla planifolia]|uniref:ARM repeat superfamily protein n=1 Tax=Vanilla planifolia TaxID=51239 RepID=A0A835V0P6_VANPL|nr:hypothetical protein HPP92_013515 [Vanilla planifolia]
MPLRQRSFFWFPPAREMKLGCPNNGVGLVIVKTSGHFNEEFQVYNPNYDKFIEMMRQHSLLRRLEPLRRSNISRSQEVTAGFLLGDGGLQIPEVIPPIPSYTPTGLPAVANALGRRLLHSFDHSCAPYFGSLAPNRRMGIGEPWRRYSTINERDDMALEEEVEKKAGWLLKLFFLVTAFAVASQFFPYMGDNLLQQSISLLHVKDPLFKRMGASRLRRFAIDDERRMKIVDMGGAHDLLKMLEGAKEDKTRKEALRTLLALSHSNAAAEVLHQAGATAIVASIPDSLEFAEVGNCKASLLNRFRELEHKNSSLEINLS